MNEDHKHPIAAGLIALVAVAVAVGLVLGVVVLVGTHVLGIDDSTADDAGAGNSGSLYVPKPSPTATGTGPLVTLSGDPSSSAPTAPTTPEGGKGSSKAPTKQITMQASAPTVSSMQPFDLTGTYSGGQGAILVVQRNDGTGWSDFPIPKVAVIGEQFVAHLQTGRAGVQKFRVKDTKTGLLSNVVKVRIG